MKSFYPPRDNALVGPSLRNVQQQTKRLSTIHQSQRSLSPNTGLRRAPKAFEARAILSSTSFVIPPSDSTIAPKYLKSVTASMASPLNVNCLEILLICCTSYHYLDLWHAHPQFLSPTLRLPHQELMLLSLHFPYWCLLPLHCLQTRA